MMSGNSNSINTGCEETNIKLEKYFPERENIAEELSTLLGHIEDSSGTTAGEETKLRSNSATAEATGKGNHDAGHVNEEDKEISQAEQPNNTEQFVPEEVSAKINLLNWPIH